MKWEYILTVPDVWLNWWANNNQNGGGPNLGYWLGLYGFMSFMTGLLMVGAIASVAPELSSKQLEVDAEHLQVPLDRNDSTIWKEPPPVHLGCCYAVCGPCSRAL